MDFMMLALRRNSIYAQNQNKEINEIVSLQILPFESIKMK